METGPDFLERIRLLCPPHTHYRAAVAIGAGPVVANHWRVGRGHMTLSFALPVADILGISPAYVLACLCHERAKHQIERDLLEALAMIYKGIPHTPPRRHIRPLDQPLPWGRRAGEGGTVAGSMPADAR